MVYQWKQAAQIKCDAQAAGEVCETLEKTVGLTAKNLLDASRPEDAPLHGEFEWDDTAAAEAYRETQAQYIIRMLCVAPDEERKEPVRAYFVTETAKVYNGVNVILQDTDKRSALLDTALKELAAFKRKYSMLSELADVFTAIEKTV